MFCALESHWCMGLKSLLEFLLSTRETEDKTQRSQSLFECGKSSGHRRWEVRGKEVVREVELSSDSRRMKKCVRYISYCCDKIPHASTSRIKGLFCLAFSKGGKGMVAGVGGNWSRGICSQETERRLLVLRSLSPLIQPRTLFPHPMWSSHLS